MLPTTSASDPSLASECDVSASDLGSWGFCARQFWYKTHGERMDSASRERLRAGTEAHHQHGLSMDSQRQLFPFFMGAGVLIILLLLWLLSRRAEAAVQSNPLGQTGIPLEILALLVGVLVGVVLLYRKMSSSTGFGGGDEVLASDTGQSRVRMLYDPETGLKGKPDYLIRRRVGLTKKIVAVELKPTRKGKEPYPWDRLQVGAYILLTLKAYGKRAARLGLVRYASGTFVVRLTRRLERDLRVASEGVRIVRGAEAPVRRSHQEAWRCRNCPFKRTCSESLA